MPLSLSQYLAAVNASMSMDPGASVAQPGPQVMGLQPGPVPMDLGAMAFGGAPPPQPMGPPPPPEQGAHVPAPAPAVIPGLDEKLRNGVPAAPTAPPIHLTPDLAAQIAPNFGSSAALPTGAEPAPTVGPAAGPTQADPGVQAPEHAFPLQAASGGGVVPAHEQEMRGPSLRGAQGNYNQAVGEAIQAHTLGGAENAGRDYALALEAERAAQGRQMAAEQAMAEREEEMLQKQHDFSQSAKALGQFAFKPDGGFWESRTTGQKIAGVFEIALNGFMAGAGRPVPSQVMMGIERSIRAQENAYHALRDGVTSQQSAFGMAMQKYQNLDAARSHVRVAAIEGLQAQAMQVAALNKGNETGMRAMAAIADLEGQKMQQIQQGIRFLPAQAVGRRFIDQNTGLVYTEQEAKQVSKDWYTHAAKRDEIGMNVAGDLMKEGAKAGAKAGALQVRLPNGEIIGARNDKEFETLNTLSASVSNAQQLVAEAKRIRSGSAWRNPYSQDRARLESIQSELTLAFKDRGGLGALSGPDMDLALGATGDITGQRGTSEAKLDQFMTATNNALRNRVKTIPTAPAAAKGDIPREAGIKWGAK